MSLSIGNKKGVGLVGVIIGIGITAIITLAIMTIVENGAKSVKTIQTMSDATDLKNEVEMRYKADYNLCLAQLAGQQFNPNNLSSFKLLNQRAAFTSAKNNISTTSQLSDKYKNVLINRYNQAASLVPASDSKACVGSICTGNMYGKAMVTDIILQPKSVAGPRQYLFEIDIKLSEQKGLKMQRTIPLVVQTLLLNASTEQIIDCKSYNTALSALELCNPSNPAECYTYNDIKPLMELLEPLVDGRHTVIACLANSGSIYVLPDGKKICQINTASCPSGWSQHLSYTATANAFYSGCHGTSCNTGFHNFANRSREYCGYKERSSMGNCSRSRTGWAAVVSVGCK